MTGAGGGAVTPRPSALASAAATAPASASAPAPATAVASAAASAPGAASGAASAAAPSGGLCDAALTVEMLRTTCGEKCKPGDAQCAVKAITPGAGDLDSPGHTCTRRFGADKSNLTLMATRHKSAGEAKAAFEEQGKEKKEEPEFKALTGLGDGARRYASITMTGDVNHTIEVVKGAYTLKLFSPKVTSNGRNIDPVCEPEKLEKLARAVVGKL